MLTLFPLRISLDFDTKELKRTSSLHKNNASGVFGFLMKKLTYLYTHTSVSV